MGENMIKNKKKSQLSLLVLIGALVLTIVFLYNVVLEDKRIQEMETEINYHTNKKNELEAEQGEIRKEITNSNSPEYIEQIARNKLDMFLPNDTVYIFNE